MLEPLPTKDVLDKYYLEARARLLELAAVLDRIDRGGTPPNDPRLALLRQAIARLHESSRSNSPTRAEELQLLFSLSYEQDWLKSFQPAR
jgi:hypothetical protein